MKILTVVGARPQFVKAAAVSRAIRAESATDLNEVIVHTGQHHDANMSAVFFSELGIPEPAEWLGIAGGSHGAMTGRMLQALDEVLIAHKPDVVLVYGDTNSTLAGAISASKLHIPVAHVEAGLRSFNRRMPEEINRVLVDHCADLLLTPTSNATARLAAEGVPEERVVWVGDVMIDAIHHYGAVAKESTSIEQSFGVTPGTYALVTIHRAENTDDPERLRVIFDGLLAAAARRPVVVPLHPRTRAALARDGMLERIATSLKVTEPVSYLTMLELERNAAVVVTDSGGVQKEAFAFRVPCITLRDETEWTELVDLGWNRLVPPRAGNVIAAAIAEASPPAADAVTDPYGGGLAAKRIIDALRSRYG